MQTFNKWRITLIFFVLIIFVLVYSGCSTQPKNPGDIYELRKRADSQLDMGNKSADRGEYETALILLTEARRLAIIVDDPSLLVRTSLSCGNVLLALGRTNESSADWNAALHEAEAGGGQELVAVSRIHIARGRLILQGASQAEDVRNLAAREINNIKTDRLYIAFSWGVIGLAQRELGRYPEAEAAVKRSLDIHEKDRYFEQAAYDWFLIASIRSLSGNYGGAMQALDSAIALDRRVENSWGLASDWRAMGDVRKKAGKTAEAREAYERAAGIFRSLGNDNAAADAESRIQ